MTAAHETSVKDRLLTDAVHNLCPPEGTTTENRSTGRAASDRERSGRRERTVRHYGGRFFDRMQSDRPFSTQEEAVTALAPIAVWFFGWAIRELAIQTIKFLWRRMNEPVVVTAVAKECGDYSG